MQYESRTFTTSIPEPSYIINDFKLLRYRRPVYDEQLTKTIKKLALCVDDLFIDPHDRSTKEIWEVFTGVELIVLVDRLHNMCSEAGEELVWMRGELGDEAGVILKNEEVEKEMV